MDDYGYTVTKFEPKTPPPPRFKLVPLDKLPSGGTSDYLIKGIIPRTGLVVVWGPPKCGKSFLIFDLMLHAALGWMFRGHRVRQGSVVYLALEGQKGFGDRRNAFYSRHSVASVPNFHLILDRTDLIRDHSQLIGCIKGQAAETPAAVVIDTMNRSLVGSESKDEDMARYLRAADAIQAELGCVVIIIHHCGIAGDRPRGHTSLTGAADVQIRVERDAANDVVGTVEAAKDMPEGVVITSRLELVELGTDQDGDPITSCVVVPVDGPTTKPSKKPPLPKAASIAQRALTMAINECGTPPPPTTPEINSRVPRDVRVTTMARWREYAYRLGISPSDQPRARQLAFQRAAQHLNAIQAVGIWDDTVWIAF